MNLAIAVASFFTYFYSLIICTIYLKTIDENKAYREQKNI